MSYSDILKPRPEVLSEDGIEGIIDLANVNVPRKLEAKPRIFLELTYPTSDIKRVIEKLNSRFNESSGTPGLFLFEGFRGSGKSHLLLLIYHLLNSPEEAKKWLGKHKLECELPKDVTVVVNKFTDIPLYSIWDFIFEKITSKKPAKSIVQPSLNQIQEVLGDRKLILIFDELEQGIGVISDSAVRKQNIAFLQMLSEWSNRDKQITIFSSIYSDREEPGSTLRRVGPVSVKFTQTQDKARVVLHRLFENYADFDPSQAEAALDSFLNLWKRHITTLDVIPYKEKMKLTYPFLPELLEIILEKVPARGGFQSVRGALGFLANMVKLTHQKMDLITAAHANLLDRETSYRLVDLDPSGDLINRAKMNLEDLEDNPLALEISSATLLYTLTESGRMRGITKEDLIKNALNPHTDINDLEKTLLRFQKYASHFWMQEGRFYFDLEEKPDAKVEFQALSISDPHAREYLYQLWKEEVFKENVNCIIYVGAEETKIALEALEKDRIRFVFSPRRLTAKERHELYHGLSNRNLVILLEPKDSEFNLEQNQDLIKWAKRQIAAKELISMTQDSERRNEYDRILREDKRYCLDMLRRVGLIFVKWDVYAPSLEHDQIEEEPITGTSREDILRFLSEQVYPAQFFYEHLLKRIGEIKNKTVKDVEQEYKITLGYPVPTYSMFNKAIRLLCREKKIGIQHSRGNYCGDDINLSEMELLQAVIVEPFESVAPTPGPRPVVTGIGGQIGTGSGIEEPPIGTVTPVQTQAISVPSQPGIGALRQAVAVRLQEFTQPKVIKAVFTAYLNPQDVDLGSLPTAYRGNITGQGTFSLEIVITKQGEFTKGQIESHIESLPNVKNAEYSARLDILISEA